MYEKMLKEYLQRLDRSELSIDGDLEKALITPLAQGEYNINYLLETEKEKRVLRLNTGSQMDLENQIGYEFTALGELFKSGRTPKPIFCDATKKELPYGFLIMEYLPGRPLDYRKDLSAAAQALADIHATKVELQKFVQPSDPKQAMIDECRELLSAYDGFGKSDPKIKAHLRHLLTYGEALRAENSDAALCCINTELNSRNFIVADDGFCRLVDWEKPIIADPAQDLGHFLAPTTTLWKTEDILTSRQIDAFLTQYRRAVDGRIELYDIEERTRNYIRLNCLRGISWCAMAWTQYQGDERAIRNEETASKLELYLSEDFLSLIEEEYLKG